MRRKLSKQTFLFAGMSDTDVTDFAIVDNRLILLLVERGLAILDLANLKEFANGERPPAVQDWDLPQPHEPRPSDGEVFVTQVCVPNVPCESDKPSYDVAQKLEKAVEDSPLPAYALERNTYRDRMRGFVLVSFGSADPDALSRLFVDVLKNEPLRSAFLIFVRHGPLGTPLVQVAPTEGAVP
jgi:hypothetical protein